MRAPEAALQISRESPPLTLSPRRPGGGGRGRGADVLVGGAAHLTLPLRGSLPLPPEGRRGTLGRSWSCRRASGCASVSECERLISIPIPASSAPVCAGAI